MQQVLRFKRFFICAVLSAAVSGAAQTPGSLLWQSSTGWVAHSVTGSGDVNGDGIADAFAGSGDDSVHCFSGGDGSVLWSYDAAADVWAVASLPDVNGDGVSDCLAGGAGNRVSCISGRPVAGGATAVWAFPTGGDVWAVAPIRDVNGDGKPDCLAGTADNMIYCLSGANGSRLWSYAASSDVLSVASIPDVNGDGKDDCVAGGKDDRVLCISGGSSGTGALLWHYQTGSTVTAVRAIGDVNGDGKPDCLAGGMDNRVVCVSGNSSGNATALWSTDTGSTVLSVFPIYDVNGDGRPDCLAGGQDNAVHCLSGMNGSAVWSYTTASSVLSVASIADGNGSGSEDCIAGGEDNRIYCIEGKSTGAGTLLWSYPTAGTVHAVAASTDLNRNGAADVLAASDDSYIYAVEGGAPAAPAETISTPFVASGPWTGVVDQSLYFTADGITSSLGHGTECRFDWGNGTVSAWGAISQNAVYRQAGNYSIKVQARCRIDTGVLSAWSSARGVSVTGHPLAVTVTGSGTVTRYPDKSGYDHDEFVTLTAAPSGGWQFDHWGGDLNGTVNPASLTMNAGKNVSAVFTQTAETVSVSAAPAGPAAGKVGQSLTFASGGGTSSLGHLLEYCFDWDDGDFSAWGASSRSRSYLNPGIYSVKTRARCQNHPDAASGWSPAWNVSVSGHTISVMVAGSGSVSRNPDKAQYNHNESVTLTAIPALGYSFDHWEGALTGSANPGSIVLTGDQSATAVFTQTLETVTIPSSLNGTSSGKVGQLFSLTAGGSVDNLGHAVEYRFDWGDGRSSGWGEAAQGAVFSRAGSFGVKAQARCKTHPGVVSGWSSTFTVTVNGYSLTILVSGSGTVAADPDKLQYNQNESVTLTAVPASGYSFDHWEGALTGNPNPGSVILTGETVVTAFFLVQAQETVTVPNVPYGPYSGAPGTELIYATGGASSSLGHPLQYRFNWGDGEMSDWNSGSSGHPWAFAGYYWITAQARCATHPASVSDYSAGFFVDISPTNAVGEAPGLTPSEFRLNQNYPNPFNGDTWITYAVPKACKVVLEIYDLQGERIATAASGFNPAGVYRVRWSGKRDGGEPLVSGIYLLRMTGGNFRAVKMMVYLR